jgi:hypothetical protein
MYTHIQGDLADFWLLDELGNKVEVRLRSQGTQGHFYKMCQ